MQINQIVIPNDIERPYGYTPMDVGTEIILGPTPSACTNCIKPLEVDDKTRKRFWLPDLPRSLNIAPIIGSDKLEYYHPTLKPKNYAATIAALENMVGEVPELQFILDWMQSDRPMELEQTLKELPKAEGDKLWGGRIVWRLQNGYIHDLPAIKEFHRQQTLQRAIGDSDGELAGILPRIHSIKLPAPLLGCNDEMTRAWGRGEKQYLNISAEMSVAASQKYTKLLETKGYHLRLDDGQYWVWGPLPEMAAISEANAGLAMLFGSKGNNLDPVQDIEDLIRQVDTGAKALGNNPNELKIVCGFIGLGGSGKGRTAVGQMTERGVKELLDNLLHYHQQQRRYMPVSKPFWTFGSLTVAEGSSKKAIARVNKQLFEAMLNGCSPPWTIVNAIIQRLKIEGVPNARQQKNNRQWSQMNFLAWIAPNLTEKNGKMKPDTSPENLLAWHLGRVFASCKTMAYHYAARGGEKLKDDWKNPMDTYRQILFSSPAQGFAQVLAKVSPYLAALPKKAFWYEKALAELGQDCPGASPPQRWTDEQAFFFALGISQAVEANFSKSSSPQGEDDEPEFESEES